MIRLLIAGLFAYATYRFTKKVIDEVPDGFEPLPLPEERRSLRRQRAAMGVEPRR
ncbi:hypothetical protein [Mesorhizobium sp. 131-2-1]|uniref:hypothetical protein n=1 Tax=Mesorhizobium sp. 131-2-1 TaxID=2744518 RepID=UPI0019285381|nr:hypothetical protein [Mesorhizobium sp. 131-2-1]BCG95784.1 hypothetical protein MesoLj131a_46480 [Mesorhizobium sp. 131-2-1]